MNDERQQNGQSWQDEGSGFPPPDDDMQYADDTGGYGSNYDDPYGGQGYANPMPSWEQRDEIGFIGAFFGSIKEILLEPQITFRQMPVTGGIWGALLFGLILGTFGYWIGMLWGFAFQTSIFSVLQAVDPSAAAQFGDQFIGQLPFTMIQAVLGPFLVVIGIFLWSAIYHVFLMLFGGAQNGFEATFRINCYVYGATSILCIVPFCGGLVAFIWCLVCLCIGLREAHQTDAWRAICAVLVPLLLCCFCGLTLIIGFASIASALA